MKPKVSVIMPIYNAEKYVKQAIESILKQTFSDFELLLINDCPSDNTLKVVESIKDDRIRIINNGSNKGIEAACGEYVALMDDDDIASRDRLEIEVKFLDEHAEISAIGGGMQTIDSDGIPLTSVRTGTLHNPLFIKAYLLFYNCIANGTVMFRKSIVDLYRIKYKDNCMGMEDYLFWLEFTAHALLTNVDNIFLYWRVSENSETKKVKEYKTQERSKAYSDILEQALKINGFSLSHEELDLYKRVFTETAPQSVDENCLLDVCKILRKLIDQAIAEKKDNVKEIMQACRKVYLRMVYSSTVWNIDGD